MAGRGEDAPTELWKSLLDPRANARALGDVQAQALRAAGDLVERLAHSVDGPEGESDERTDAAGGGSAPSGDAARLVDVWLEMLSRIASAFDGSASPGSDQNGRVDVDLLASGGGRLRLVATPLERSAAAEIWLHNRSAEPISALCLHAGDLLSPAGVPLVATMAFDPCRIDEMPARSSRGVELTVTVHEGAAPGTFRGVLQIAGAPQAWVALELVVGAREGDE
jgi:hypothetical protein